MTHEPGQRSPSGGVRASDAEREAVVERLRVATVEGRLTLGELTERTEAAYTATTRGELVRVTADLPEVPGSTAVQARPAGGDREWVVAVMGDSKRQGRWRVERPLAALAVMGDVVLDLRGAADGPQGGGQGHGRHGRCQGHRRLLCRAGPPDVACLADARRPRPPGHRIAPGSRSSFRADDS